MMPSRKSGAHGGGWRRRPGQMNHLRTYTDVPVILDSNVETGKLGVTPLYISIYMKYRIGEGDLLAFALGDWTARYYTTQPQV